MDLLRNIFKGDKVIWIIFLLLCLISIVEVFSASSTLIYRSGNHWEPITRHAIFLMVGAGVVVLFHNINYKWFQAFPFFLLPFSAVFLLLLLLFDDVNLGGLLVIEKVNDAGRWVRLLGFQFQPSEFAKMAVVIVTAFILSKGQREKTAAPGAFKYITLITVVICGLILPENFSTAFLLAFVVFLMMIIGRVQARKLWMLVGGVGALAVAGVVFLEATKGIDNDFLHRFDTWRGRIEQFVDPPQVSAADFDINRNAQVGHARIAVASSNVLGKGPGNSVERDFLSQAFSDFIYAIIIEELGLVGGIIVVFLYIWLLIRAGKIAQQCERTFPAFLVMGIGLLLVTQAMFNMMVAVGLAPVTGQPLPLISRGGTSTIINCVYIGMLLSVSRYTANLKEEQEREALAQLPAAADEPTDAGAVPAQPFSEAQTAEEPTSQMLNSDDEFK